MCESVNYLKRLMRLHGYTNKSYASMFASNKNRVSYMYNTAHYIYFKPVKGCIFNLTVEFGTKMSKTLTMSNTTNV